MTTFAKSCALVVLCAFTVSAAESIHLAAVPSLTPDGETLVFNWNNDIWSVPIEGGEAALLTAHPARDHWPRVSPDGETILFQSNRHGHYNLYTMPIAGGPAKQLTFHSEGFTPHDWFPDGKTVLAEGWRDYTGFSGKRPFKVNIENRQAPELICDDYVANGRVSPDGKRILFTREGVLLYRKGYKGSRASQIWLYDIAAKSFKQLCSEAGGTRSPLWRPDGDGFYYLSQRSGSFNLWEHDLKSGKEKQLTFHEDASVILPTISRDGKTIVYRWMFDFYRFNPRSKRSPKKIEIWHNSDRQLDVSKRRWYNKIWNNGRWGTLDWTEDNLEMVFCAGGDLWVMDTVIKEPVRVFADSASDAIAAVFSRDAETILFLRDRGDRVTLWRASRGDPSAYWYQNRGFKLEQLTDNDEHLSQLSFSPDGEKIVFAVDNADLYIADPDGSNRKLLFDGVDTPYYDWSPDSKWLACQLRGHDDNWDIWIVSTTGAREPCNITRYPDWDGTPRWSPNGRILAFVGERENREELDLFYVFLEENKKPPAQHITDVATAEKRLRASRPPTSPEDDGSEGTSVAEVKESKPPAKVTPPAVPAPKPVPAVKIDFDGLHRRVQRIKLKDTRETSPFWSHDSKVLAFQSNYGNKDGTYKLFFPHPSTKPELMTTTKGDNASWPKAGIRWTVDGMPAHYTTQIKFKAYQEIELESYQRLAFRRVWRTLKDSFYDDRFNNRDWDAMLKKYEDMAATAPDSEIFDRVVAMLEGELNASHTGFTIKEEKWNIWKAKHNWESETANIGLRFDHTAPGPGLTVNWVLQDGPTDQPGTHVAVGEKVLRIGGLAVEPGDDLTRFLNGQKNRLISLTVQGLKDGKVRDIRVDPITFEKARDLAWEQWIDSNVKMVDKLSDGKLGYVHVDRMQWDEFWRFERDLFANGYDKEGMIIDVRNNSGGFTADNMLAILCQPRHAVTIPRGGKRDYPRGYLVYQSWEKPVTIICNQNTGSNGEIFSHAIKTLKRGKIVGVPTQGAVISRPTRNISDLGDLSVPRRGWFTLDGEDMEENGAQPDIVLWPHPGDIPAGKDTQLEKAVDVLKTDVAAEKAKPELKLNWASERRLKK